MIIASGWSADSPLYDPMCGSGTLLIEAYHIAQNIAPGLSRERYAFMNWKDYNQSKWDELCQEAKSEIKSLFSSHPGKTCLSPEVNPLRSQSGKRS